MWYLLKVDANGFFTLKTDTNVWANQLIFVAQSDSNQWTLTKLDANGFYALKTDVNVWTNQLLVPYLTKVDANGFYTLKSDTNTWASQLIFVAQQDSNKWTLTKLDANALYALKADVNVWTQQLLVPYLTKADANGFFTLKTDTNVWANQLIIAAQLDSNLWTLTKVDANALYALKSDVNIWTNQLLVPYLTKVDANGFFTLITDSNVWTNQLILSAQADMNKWVLTKLDGNALYALKWDVNVWIDQKIAGISLTDTNWETSWSIFDINMAGTYYPLFDNPSSFISGVYWNQILGDQNDINLSGFYNDAGFITGYIDTNWQTSWNTFDANMRYYFALKSDVNIWTNQLLVPYLTKTDANGFYPLKGDVNTWASQLIFVAQTDSNHWTLTKLDGNALYALKTDVNVWTNQLLVPYLLKVDANGFYPLKSDINIWAGQLDMLNQADYNIWYLNKIDANIFFAYKNDVNLWGDQRYLSINTVLPQSKDFVAKKFITDYNAVTGYFSSYALSFTDLNSGFPSACPAGSYIYQLAPGVAYCSYPTDTNWQTSWALFDANMKATYTQLNDTNIWIDQKLVPYLLKTDANGFYPLKADVNIWIDQKIAGFSGDTNWQTSWPIFDANMKATYTTLSDTNIWANQLIFIAQTDSNYWTLTKLDGNALYALKTDVNVWTNDLLVPYLTKVDANGFYTLKTDTNVWANQLIFIAQEDSNKWTLTKLDANALYALKTDVNVWTQQLLTPYLLAADANGFFTLKTDTNVWVNQLIVSAQIDSNQWILTKVDANALYALKSDVNIWTNQLLVPYLTKADANGFYTLKSDSNIWTNQLILSTQADMNQWVLTKLDANALYTLKSDTNVWIDQKLVPYLSKTDANGFYPLKADVNIWTNQLLVPYLTKTDANGFYALKVDVNTWIGQLDTNWQTSWNVFDANMKATYTQLNDTNIWIDQKLVPYLSKVDANGFYPLKGDVNTWINQIAVPYTGAIKDVNLGSHGIAYYDANWTGGRVTYVPLDANIQVYIDNATAGDTLILGSGTYTITSTIRVNKTLNITSNGGTKIFNVTADLNMFLITASNSRLADFNIIDLGNNTKVIFLDGVDNVRIKNMLINTTGAGYEYGIWVQNSSATIFNSDVSINSTDQNSQAVKIINTASATKDQNVIIESSFLFCTGVIRCEAVEVFNQNTGYAIGARIYNSQVRARTSGVQNLTYGLSIESTTTNNAFAYVYNSTIGGNSTDINVLGNNVAYLYATTLFNGTIGGNVHYLGTNTTNTIYFDTNGEPGTYQEGKLFYDDMWHTLSAQIGRDVTMQIGQEEFRRVYNNTGAIVRNGQAVITNGIFNGFPTIALAQANTESTAQVLGLATQDIPINDYGFITVRGNINDLNTNDASWTEGDVLYLSETTPGAVTNIAPESPNYEMRIGRLIIKDTNTGRINVRIIPYTNLSNLGDVTITSPTVSQVLTYNGVSWVNSAASNTSASNGIAFYLDSNDINAKTTQNAFALEQLFKVPVTTTPQQNEVLSATATVAPIGSAYLYNTDLNRTVLDGGTWTFYTYGAVNSTGAGRISSLANVVYKVRNYVRTDTNVTMAGAGVTRYVIATANAPFSTALIDTNFTANDQNLYAGYLQTPKGLYKVVGRTSDTNITISVPSTYVNETAVKFSTWKRLFFAQTPTITAIAPNYTLYISTASSGAIDMNTTDRIGLVMVGISNNTTTVTYVYNGTANQSYFNTPLITLHNNLAGLQGGVANEYYHLTQADFIIATQAATNLQNGYLTSGDWVTFNAKASISDLNAYTLLSDTNVWSGQLDRQMQIDSNKWTLTKVDGNALYALKNDVNVWIQQQNSAYLTKADANGFFTLKADTNIWANQLIILAQTDSNKWILTKVDGNALYALKGDVNNWIDQKIAGLSVDTNWQTSWSVFDANMRSIYTTLGDVNLWGDIRYQPKQIWNLSDSNISMVTKNAYYINAANMVGLTLPTSVTTGDILEITDVNANGFTIMQGNGQKINFAGTSTTIGTGGTITSRGTLSGGGTTSLTDGIVAYYKLDSTGSAIDSVNGIDGTNSNILSTTGIINDGYNFNGTSSGVTTSADANIDFNRDNAFSIFGWIKTTNDATKTIISHMEGGSAAGYLLRIGTGAKLEVIIVNASGGPPKMIDVRATDTRLDDGAWHYVGFTYDGSSDAGGMNLYVDGALEGMSALQNDVTGSTTAAAGLSFGINTPVSGWFDGNMDEIGVWNRVLGSTEVTELYNSGAGKSYSFTTPFITAYQKNSIKLVSVDSNRTFNVLSYVGDWTVDGTAYYPYPGSVTNIFDQDLNTTSDVNFGSIMLGNTTDFVLDGGGIKGIGGSFSNQYMIDFWGSLIDRSGYSSLSWQSRQLTAEPGYVIASWSDNNYKLLSDVNGLPYLNKWLADTYYPQIGDVNVWADQKLAPYLSKVDANGFYPLKSDVNTWATQLDLIKQSDANNRFLTKIDANGFYTIKADTNVWIDQRLVPYVSKVDANGFYALKTDVNIWGDQRYLKLTGGSVTGSIVASQDMNAKVLKADTNIYIGTNGYIYDDGNAIIIGRR
jgi:hypothetical protein